MTFGEVMFNKCGVRNHLCFALKQSATQMLIENDRILVKILSSDQFLLFYIVMIILTFNMTVP